MCQQPLLLQVWEENIKEIWLLQRRKMKRNFFNVEILTMLMNEQPPLWPLAHLLDPREREEAWVIKYRYNLWKDFSKRDNNRVAEWNSRAREEHERQVTNLKIIKHQDTL